MKPFTVNANQVAISYKNGIIHKVYTAGKHFIGFLENPIRYTIGTLYDAPINQELALQNTNLLEVVDVITIPDNYIAIKFYNNSFIGILEPGTFIYFKNVHPTTFQLVSLLHFEINNAIDDNLLKLPVFNTYIRQLEVLPSENGLLFVDGKLQKVLQPGKYKYFINATALQLVKADMRAIAMEISGQEILTKDKAQLRINLYASYKIADIITYVATNKDADKQLYTALQMAARAIIGALTIDELMANKEAINTAILAESVATTQHLGVTIIACGIKDIILPADIKHILNQVLIADKKAQANIIMRREETASTRSLLNTAKLMEDNAMLLKLKEMEYVEKIAEKLDSISLNGNSQIVDQLKTIFVK